MEMTEEGFDSLLTRALGSSPKLRIIDYLLDYKLNDFTKKEIVEALGMSKLTFYKYFKDLEELGLVAASRKIGRATLYKINLENPMVKMLIEYETKLSLQIAEQEAEKMKKPEGGRFVVEPVPSLEEVLKEPSSVESSINEFHRSRKELSRKAET